MTTLLHVSASPAARALSRSGSRRPSSTQVNPSTTVETLDLWDGSLPTFGPLGASAKMTAFGGGTPEGEAAKAWARAQNLADQFTGADLYLFSMPMWNAGVPYVLKQWIDIITQPGMVFGFDPAAGYYGLVHGKEAAAIYTSGVYAPGAPLAYGKDFHASFMNDWLRFVGVEDVTEIRFQPTILTATPDDDRATAHAAARDAAKVF